MTTNPPIDRDLEENMAAATQQEACRTKVAHRLWANLNHTAAVPRYTIAAKGSADWAGHFNWELVCEWDPKGRAAIGLVNG